MKKVFSFDAETNGLWGQPFAIGAVVYAPDGRETARFIGRLPDTVVTDSWVRANVLPALADVPVTHERYWALLADFAHFYLTQKENADIIVHMGVPVESRVLRDMHDLGIIGDWDGPYPLHDLVGYLGQAGDDPTSVDAYIAKHGLIPPSFDGGTHNPLYDAAAAAAVYRHLRGWWR